MKSILKVAILMSLFLPSLSLVGNVPLPPADIPDNLTWENHDEDGIAFAVTLGLNKAEYHVPGPVLTVYIKNISKDIVSFIVSGRDEGLCFFVIEPSHKFRLHVVTLQNRVFADPINPGEVKSYQAALTAKEVELVRSHPLEVDFAVANASQKKPQLVSSKPTDIGLK